MKIDGGNWTVESLGRWNHISVHRHKFMGRTYHFVCVMKRILGKKNEQNFQRGGCGGDCTGKADEKCEMYGCCGRDLTVMYANISLTCFRA